MEGIGDIHNLNMKYAIDRHATQGIVAKLLAARDQVLALLCRLSEGQLLEHERPRAMLVTEFCQLLTDYLAAAHFGLYGRLEEPTERRRPVLELAAALCPDIAATTEFALEFSEKYTGDRSQDASGDLHADLSRLGEVLARRIEIEDRLIGALVGPVGTVHAPCRQETLDPLVTERLARLAVIEEQASDTFGDPEIARAWLRAENIGLGGCTPLSMLDTDIGSREVAKILVAIAHGGAA